MYKRVESLKELNSVLDVVYKEDKEVNTGFGNQNLYIFTSTEEVLVFNVKNDTIHISKKRYEKGIKNLHLIDEGYGIPMEYYIVGDIEIPSYNASKNSREEFLEVLYRQLEPSSNLSNQILIEHLI